MDYIPPSPSGISFVFSGVTYTPPNANTISFVFSQGGITPVYTTGIVPAQFLVSAEGGIPVEGTLSATLTLAVVAAGAAPVNGSINIQPGFSATAEFAPVGFAAVDTPFSVFAYKVPDVTGAVVFAPPFVITAARSAGAIFNVPFGAFGLIAHGISGDAMVYFRPVFSTAVGSGRVAAAEFSISISVAAHSSITVESKLSTALPIRVTAVGRTNVRGIAGFSVPLRASGACDIRLEGGVQALAPFIVTANNSDVKQGNVVASIIFEADVIGSVGSGGSAQFEPSFVVIGVGSKPKYGFVEASFKFSVAATGGSGVAGSVTSKLDMSCTASGEYRDFYSGTVQASLRLLVTSSIHIPKTQTRPCLYIKTSNDKVMVRK